jgi:hypothetical protein
MSSFEWMELQTLTSDINTSRARLAQARASKDHRVIRTLEAEIAAAEARRDRLVTHITTDLTAHPELAPSAEAAKTANPVAVEAATGETAANGGGTPEPPPVPVEAPAAGGAVSSAAAAEADGVKGGIIVWDQLTPRDIERAQSAIGARRTEMLARHADELKVLERDQTELEGLEQAIAAFVRRFRPPRGEDGADIVELGDERELRVQGRG